MQYISTGIAALMMGIMGFFGIQGAQQFSAAPSVLKVQQGGTGASTFSAGDCLVGNGTSPITTQPCSAGGGEANTGGSLGTGLNIFDSKSGVALRFNTLAAGSNITLSTTTNSNTIVIASTASGGSGFSTTSADYYRSVTGRVATSAQETAGQLSYFTSTNGNPATLGGIATGTVSSSGGITTTASRYVLNGALAISCDVASGSIPGCLSAADWTTFNNKASFAYPFPSNATTTALTFSGGLTSSTSTSGTLNAGDVTATSTFQGAGLADCDTAATSKLLWDVTTRRFSCGTDQTGAGGGAYPFTPDTNYGVLVQATSGIPWFQNALTASSTSYINELFLTEPLSVSSGGTNNSSQTPGGVAYSPAGNSISTGNNFTFDGLNVAIGSSSPNARLSMHLGALDDFIANMFEIGSSTASATTTLFSVANTGVLTSNALSTSTFSGGLSVLNFSQTGTATSSFNNGASFANGTIRLATLVSCSEALETDADGNIICGTDQTGGGGGTPDSKWATSTVDSTAIHTAGAEKVGIATTSPMSVFGVVGTSSLNGTTQVLNNPLLVVDKGAGYNNPFQNFGTFFCGMGFLPGYTAFRGGCDNDNTHWTHSKIGAMSFAFGSDATAIGDYSAAFGDNSTTSAQSSFIAGRLNTITSAASYATAFGYSNYVTGDRAFAVGDNNFVKGYSSAGIGSNNTTNGGNQYLIGKSNTALGTQPTYVLGDGNTTNDDVSIAIGQNNTATAYTSTAIGHGNNSTGATAFAFGLNVDTSGASSIGFGTNLTVSGSNAMAFGTGVTTGSDLTNNKDNSIYFGSRSTLPSLVIVDSLGAGKVGAVGIASTSPSALFAIDAPSGYSTTTLFAIAKNSATLFTVNDSGAASTTQLYGAMLSACNPTTGKLAWSAGQFSCGTDNSASSTLLTDKNTFSNSGTTTITNGLSVGNFAQTGIATSTFANGIQLTSGCFRMPDGTCLTNGAATSPGGPSNSIQYNGGTFSGSANLTWDNGNSILYVGDPAAQHISFDGPFATIRAGVDGTGTGIPLILRGGNGASGDLDGADVVAYPGEKSGAGTSGVFKIRDADNASAMVTIGTSLLSTARVAQVQDADGTLAYLTDIPSTLATSTLLADWNTWSGDQTFGNITVTGTCTGCGTASAGGSNMQVQFNDGGSTLAGALGLIWNKTKSFFGIGTTTPMHHLDVDGRIAGQPSYDCNIPMLTQSNVTADQLGSATVASFVCDGHMWLDVNVSPNAGILALSAANELVATGTPQMQIMDASIAAALNTSLVFMKGPFAGSATSSLGNGIAMEVTFQTPNVNTATTAVNYIPLAFTDTAITSITSPASYHTPTNGCAVIASSTPNWKLVCWRAGVATMADTGLATSTAAHKGLLTLNTAGANVYFNDNPTAAANIPFANIPTANLRPIIGVDLMAGVTLAQARMRVGNISVWTADLRK